MSSATDGRDETKSDKSEQEQTYHALMVVLRSSANSLALEQPELTLHLLHLRIKTATTFFEKIRNKRNSLDSFACKQLC